MITKKEFNLEKRRKELLTRFSETPLFDVMPLIREQDKEFIRLVKERISDFKYIEHDENFNEWGVVPVESVFEIIDKLAGEKMK